MSKQVVRGGDVAELLERFARLREKARARTGKVFPFVVIQEAGLDGFWIDRALQNDGIESHVVDPASIATSRRRRRAKTDGIDGEALVRALLAGNPRLRTTLIQLAWLWLRHQPQSALTLWVEERVRRNGGPGNNYFTRKYAEICGERADTNAMMCRARVIKDYDAQDRIRRKLDELASTERDVRRAQESDAYTASRPELDMPGDDGGAGGRNSSTFNPIERSRSLCTKASVHFFWAEGVEVTELGVLCDGDSRLCV